MADRVYFRGASPYGRLPELVSVECAREHAARVGEQQTLPRNSSRIRKKEEEEEVVVVVKEEAVAPPRSNSADPSRGIAQLHVQRLCVRHVPKAALARPAPGYLRYRATNCSWFMHVKLNIRRATAGLPV